MSPIPYLTAFALEATPSVIDNATEQTAPVTSQHILTTGGLLFVAVVVVTLAGYFHHGRRARTNNGWAGGLSGFLSSLRSRGSAGTSDGATSDLPCHPTVAFEHHVNMVYARYFHPTHWNFVEAYPATPSTPAIFVEDEATGIPVAEPKPFGMNSFLSMDDEDDSNDGACKKRHRVKTPPPYDTRSSVNIDFHNDVIGSTFRPGAFLTIPGMIEDNPEDASDSLSSFESLLDLYSLACDDILVIPPASASVSSLGSRCGNDDILPTSATSSKSADCTSEGTDAMTRSGALPSIPEELEEDLTELSSYISDHFAYDGVLTASGLPGGTERDDGVSFNFEMDTCHGATFSRTTSSRVAVGIPQQHGETSTNQHSNFSSMSYDDVPMRPQGSRSRLEEHCEMDLWAAKVDSARDIIGDPFPSISEELEGLHEDSSFGSQLDYYFSANDATTALGSSYTARSRRHGIADMTNIVESLKYSSSEDFQSSECVDTDSVMPCNSLVSIQPADDERIREIDSRDSVHDDSCGLETSEVRDECLDLMRRLLEELRDPSIDYSARSLSEDSESIYSVDDEHEPITPHLTPTLGLNIRRKSVVSASLSSRTETESSEEERTYPFTPPPRSSTLLTRSLDDRKVHIRSPARVLFAEDVRVVSPTSSSSPPASPPHPFFNSHRDSLFLYNPHSSMVALPPL
ncbi:hypothetical protein JVU11DRAFT_1178 [Chiua virens]|nr:hypothetical protein JVU11DRAFT_1178 [Chiua virens]